MSTGSVSQATAQLPAQQNLQRPQSSPFIRSQSRLGAGGLPDSAMDPSTATKVGQVMAGTVRGHIMNVTA